MGKASNPIAVFDSGVGGISVLREMVKIMPHEDFLYYGDSKNAPYGTKTKEEVRNLTIQHVQEFLDAGCKAVAVACNTATSAAVATLREMYPDLPLVGIEPALKPAALYKEHGKVLVMATPMTIREGKFQHLLDQYADTATVYQLPCAGLMEFVEGGHYNSKEIKTYHYKCSMSFKKDTYEKRINRKLCAATHKWCKKYSHFSISLTWYGSCRHYSRNRTSKSHKERYNTSSGKTYFS